MMRLTNSIARASALVRLIILYHYRALERSVAVFGLMVIVGLIAAVLFLNPSGVAAPEMSRIVSLDVTTLDALELLIEERQTQLEEGLVLPARTFFVVPNR